MAGLLLKRTKIDNALEHWLAPAKFILGLGPGSADMTGGIFDEILVSLTAAFGA